jgi:folylpolyglutamate synthase/dihydropteroate synthase
MVLAGLNPDRWILGLERMRKALEILGHPEGSYPHVLVAGTTARARRRF